MYRTLKDIHNILKSSLECEKSTNSFNTFTKSFIKSAQGIRKNKAGIAGL